VGLDHAVRRVGVLGWRMHRRVCAGNDAVLE
jgi:hypothetical protein